MGRHLNTIAYGIAVAVAVALAGSADAQTAKLPKTTRTVYKCEVGGQVKYSDEPCMGAQKVDVTPTRGLDKDSGRKVTGTDVRRERTQEQMTEVLRPVLGMTHEERMTLHRRYRLTPAAKRECEQLDARMAGLEAQERGATADGLAAIQRALLADRTRHRKLAC